MGSLFSHLTNYLYKITYTLLKVCGGADTATGSVEAGALFKIADIAAFGGFGLTETVAKTNSDVLSGKFLIYGIDCFSRFIFGTYFGCRGVEYVVKIDR